MHSATADRNENAPKCEWAFLLIDVLNDLDFSGNERMVRSAPELAENIRHAKQIARSASVPTIYVNDHFGQWRSNLAEILEHVKKSKSKGLALVEKLEPDREDYFVIKPMHSAFFGTPLDILLAELGVKKLILVGVAADICVLYSANDAYMRNFELVILEDCVESNTEEEKQYALTHMKKRLRAKLMKSHELETFLNK